MEAADASEEQLAGMTYRNDMFQQLYCSLLSLALLAEGPALPLRREISETVLYIERLIGGDAHFLIARTMQTAKSLCLVQIDRLQQTDTCISAAELLHLTCGLH